MSQQELLCPNCRGGNSLQARHCQWCGKPLSEPQPPVYSAGQVYQDQRPAQQKSQSGCVAALSTFLIGSVVLLVSVYIQSLFATNNTTPRPATGQSGAASTPYNNPAIGITAQLPGGNWEDRSFTLPDADDEEMRITSDKRLFFSVASYPNIKLSTEAEFRSFINAFASAALVPPFNITETSYAGYPAYRLEGTLTRADLASDYHEVVYFLTAHAKLYIISGASKTSEWEQGGKEDVTLMLNSVKIK